MTVMQTEMMLKQDTKREKCQIFHQGTTRRVLRQGLSSIAPHAHAFRSFMTARLKTQNINELQIIIMKYCPVNRPKDTRYIFLAEPHGSSRLSQLVVQNC